jgi:hypothetical protein
MSVNVYWSYLGESWLRAKQPENFSKNFYKKYKDKSVTGEVERMLSCPAMQNYSKNVYAIRSMFDYEIVVEKDFSVTSSIHDQIFFEKYFIVRDANVGLFSLVQPYIFFTDDPSLEMTWQIPPFLEQPQNYYHIPGKYDIGKWFRSVDFSFLMKDGERVFSIKNDEIYTYVEFHTSEKINFIKFEPTEKIKFYSQSAIFNNFGTFAKPRKLSSFYDIFNTKSNILKEIRSCVIE